MQTTTGDNNIAVGRSALGANTTGDSNTAIGTFALDAATTANNNTAVGYGALTANTTAQNNTAIGHNCLDANETGDDLVGVGQAVLSANTTGSRNTGVGRQALTANTTGENNTAVGQAAAMDVTTGDNNCCLGNDAGRTSSPSGSITTGSNNFVLGNNSVANLYCADTSISSSDARDKTDVEDFKYGLSWITALRPVTYRWDRRTWYADDENPKGIPDGSKKRDRIHIGFLAQEAIEVEKKFGYGDKKDNMLIANQDEDENDPSYGMKYERLVPVLVNAIKELSAKVEELESKLNN